MNIFQPIPNKLLKRVNWRSVAIVSLVIIVVAFLGFLYDINTRNYAQDAAQPIESVLLKGGAIKKCVVEDPGRGPDNSVPTYEGRYQLNDTPEAAVKLITKAAADNGYKLIY